jgi:hypothetical protein
VTVAFLPPHNNKYMNGKTHLYTYAFGTDHDRLREPVPLV